MIQIFTVPNQSLHSWFPLLNVTWEKNNSFHVLSINPIIDFENNQPFNGDHNNYDIIFQTLVGKYHLQIST